LGYFLAILLISAVIAILEDLGSLLPAHTVTVKNDILGLKMKSLQFLRFEPSIKIDSKSGRL